MGFRRWKGGVKFVRVLPSFGLKKKKKTEAYDLPSMFRNSCLELLRERGKGKGWRKSDCIYRPGSIKASFS